MTHQETSESRHQGMSSELNKLADDDRPAPLYLPPNRTSDLRTWNKVDVIRWVAQFLKPSQNKDTFGAIKVLVPFDGDVLGIIARCRPAHQMFGIPEEGYDAIVRHLKTVVNTPFEVDEQPSEVASTLPNKPDCT